MPHISLSTPPILASLPDASPPPQRASHAAQGVLQIVAGASSYAAGTCIATMWLAPRLRHAGSIGLCALAIEPCTGWLARHLAGPAPQAAPKTVWTRAASLLHHVMQGVAWGLLLPAVFGALHPVWLGLSAVSVAVACGLDSAQPAQPSGYASAWAMCESAARIASAALEALWLETQLAIERRRRPAPKAPALLHAQFDIAYAHTQQRAQTAWQSLAACEAAAWRNSPSLWPPGPDNARTWGKAAWTLGCSGGVLYAGYGLVQACSVGCTLGFGMLLPRQARAAVSAPQLSSGAARAAGEQLAYHTFFMALSMGTYAT